MHQVRARRAARRDPRYKGQKHSAGIWQRRLALKLDKAQTIQSRKGRKK